MSSKGLSYGLNLTRKSNDATQPPAKRKPIFGGDDDSDEDPKAEDGGREEIGELGEVPSKYHPAKSIEKKGPQISIGSKPKLNASKKAQMSMFGDLSSALTSKKHAEAAEELDANIYDYDAVYDSLKPKKKIVAEEKKQIPKYMSCLIAAATVRKRDSTIAEEKKLAREREAEGDEYADKEKFVTSAYKKQQEENRRLEEEERLREEEERRNNKGTGMTNFYKNMLERDEQKHAAVVRAAEERIKQGPQVDATEDENTKTEADIAREINEKRAGTIAVNDEGQVVDKRELLKSGLNVIAKAKWASNANPSRSGSLMPDRGRGNAFVGAGGGKQAMRERQSRMMEAQLEQVTKRALEEEEEERRRVERASKSRKTESDIMSAKERYLARKREAEEAKKRGE